ncbi:MAG: SDR family oxidoreductase [Bryobacteraceae bacterium]|jgi:NAD(P)-dependent dehydrogenase (short-subunit alcohol dehydrogenase family)
MEQTLSGKIAIVTGGTRGIGRAIAERLLREGAAVAVCSRAQQNVQIFAKDAQPIADGRLLAETADVSKLEDVRRFFQSVDARFGGLDFLINNAGIGVFKSVADLTPEEWRRSIDLNLSGVYYCSHEALPRMRKRGAGYIVNISSLAGKNAFAGGAAYNATKFGLNGFSEAMMLDHRYENVRVSYIMPGSVDTEFSPRAGAAPWKIQSEDIAEVVGMLLRMPARTLISRVEIRPAKPQK